VEVSTDGGQSWKIAKLGGRPTQYGWRLFQLDWKAAEGSYKLVSRATNAAGESQPLTENWNPNGYLWNVAQPVSVTIAAQAPAVPAAAPANPETAYPEGYRAACFACHDEHMMQQQRLTRAQWDREINKMTGWGAPLKAQDRDAVLNYLSNQFR
jgi:hypothetical protein